MNKVLTEESMPRRMPSFNILPLEQSSENFLLRRHPRASQIDFLLSKNPGRLLALFWCREREDIPIGFSSRRKLRHCNRSPDGAGKGDDTTNAALVSIVLSICPKYAHVHPSPASKAVDSIKPGKHRSH